MSRLRARSELPSFYACIGGDKGAADSQALGNDSVLVPASSKRLIEKCRAEGLTVYDPDVSMAGLAELQRSGLWAPRSSWVNNPVNLPAVNNARARERK